MNKRTLTIWGRELELEVCLECYPGETVLEQQKETLERFLSAPGLIESTAAAAEAYLARDASAAGVELIPGNLFRYVMPQSIYIPRGETGRVAAVLCSYRLDMEHGLALIFENEQLRAIDRQDAVL